MARQKVQKAKHVVIVQAKVVEVKNKDGLLIRYVHNAWVFFQFLNGELNKVGDVFVVENVRTNFRKHLLEQNLQSGKVAQALGLEVGVRHGRL